MPQKNKKKIIYCDFKKKQAKKSLFFIFKFQKLK